MKESKVKSSGFEEIIKGILSIDSGSITEKDIDKLEESVGIFITMEHGILVRDREIKELDSKIDERNLHIANLNSTISKQAASIEHLQTVVEAEEAIRIADVTMDRIRDSEGVPHQSYKTAEHETI